MMAIYEKFMLPFNGTQPCRPKLQDYFPIWNIHRLSFNQFRAF